MSSNGEILTLAEARRRVLELLGSLISRKIGKKSHVQFGYHPFSQPIDKYFTETKPYIVLA